jgi:hypothetical protein
MNNVDEIRQQMELKSNEELITILLEHDEGQWRPEVFDIVDAILRERGVSADKVLKYVEGPESVLSETEGLKLITVAEYVSRLDAENDRLILENEGVKSWIFEEDNLPADGTPPSVQLKVCAEDWRAAMERLGSEDMFPPDLPEDMAAPPCPKCGSRRVNEKMDVVEVSADPGHAVEKWLCYCVSCGYQWDDTERQ